MLNQKPPRAIIETAIYFSSLLLNIFLGWVLAKFNTANLELADYGRYSFFIIVLYFSRTFFGFGMFDSASRLLAITPHDSERKQLLGAGLLFSCGFIILYSLFFLLSAGISDRLFEVKIGDLCLKYVLLVGVLLLHSYYVLALRGTGNIKLLSLLTVSPRIVYLFFLILILIMHQFTLVQSLNMFFLGFIVSLIWTTVYLRPSFSNWKHSMSGLWRTLKSYGIHLYLSSIWNEILFHADKFIISYFLTAQSMAYYALGYTLTFALSHFSSALVTTMFNRFAVQDRISLRVIGVNITFVVLSVFIFIVLRRFIIINLFSIEYLPTVAIMLPLALAFGFSSISKPFSMFLTARGEGKTVRNISILVPSLNIILGILIIPRYQIIGAAWTAVIVYFLDLFLYLVAYLKFIRVQAI
jgi:O-antigen/teichoic acid export membrane protein